MSKILYLHCPKTGRALRNLLVRAAGVGLAHRWSANWPDTPPAGSTVALWRCWGDTREATVLLAGLAELGPQHR